MVRAGTPWLVVAPRVHVAATTAIVTWWAVHIDRGHGRGPDWLDVIRHRSMSVDGQLEGIKVRGCNNDSVECATGLSYSCSMLAVGCSDSVILG